MAKELNLGVIFYGVATKAMQSIDQLEARLKKLNTGFVVSGKAATSSSKAISGQAKSAKGLANEMSLVGKKIGQVTGGIQRLTAAMKVTASYGLAATAIFGVINAFKAGTAAIFDFDQALKNLQAITGAIDAEIAVLGDKIREVAARTKYSAKEVSDATVLLGQAGFDAAESLDAIEAVAMLATGTLTDMATTADLLTTAIRAFDLETSEAGKVADIFATAVNKSKLTIDKLRTAFNYLGPVASNAGLSLEETAASTMVLANAGLRGSTIGTGFRQVLARLIAPSEKLRLAFRAAGADLEKLNPLTNDFSVVLDELSKVVTHSGIAIRLFGMRASAAAVAIAKGSDKYKEMLDYTYRVGVATEMAEKQMEGLAVMAKNLGDKLHNLAIALGEGGIAGAFRVVLNILRPLVDLMTLAADNVIGRFIVAVTSLTAVMTALTLAVRYLVIQLSAVALGYTVAAVKAMMLEKSQGFLLISAKALKETWQKLMLVLRNHPFVRIITVISIVATAFYVLRKSIMEGTIELQKQSIELLKSEHRLKSYADQLEEAKEGSREYKSIMERLINDYPELADEVDRATMSWEDQGDALDELIDKKHDEYVASLIDVVQGYADQANRAKMMTGAWIRVLDDLGKTKQNLADFFAVLQKLGIAPSDEDLKVWHRFIKWVLDDTALQLKMIRDYWVEVGGDIKKSLTDIAEAPRKVGGKVFGKIFDTTKEQREAIRQLGKELVGYGITAESTIEEIAAAILKIGKATEDEAEKQAVAIKKYLNSVTGVEDAFKRLKDKIRESLEGPTTILGYRAMFEQLGVEWVNLFDELGRQNVVLQGTLIKTFNETSKAIAKEKELLKERFAEDPALLAKKMAEAEEVMWAAALEKFKKSLESRKKTYDDFFKEIEQLNLKAIRDRENAEIARADIAHDKRLKKFEKELKDRLDLEKDYETELEKYTKKSEEVRLKEKEQIQAKYAKKRLDNEASKEIELNKYLLEISKKGVDERVAAGIDTIAEGNRKKAELEVQYRWTVAQIYTAIFNDIKTKYGEDTKEYVKALNDKLKALAEFEKVQAKLITIDLEDLKDAEKIYEQFLNNVQNAFADTFADIFKGNFEGFQGLMQKMSDLFIDTLAQMAAEAAMKKFTTNIQTGTTTTGSSSAGYWGAAGMAFTAASWIMDYQQRGKERDKYVRDLERKRLQMLEEAYKSINKEIDLMLANYNDVEQAIYDINETFNEYRLTLVQLGATIEQINEVEIQRAAALEAAMERLRDAFIKPLKDYVAQLSLNEYEYEQYQLKAWYEEKISYARYLGEEAVNLLYEAYILAEKQLWLKQQEALTGAQAEYQEIVATMGMTPIELEFYYLKKTEEVLDELLAGVKDRIDALKLSISGWETAVTDLTAAYDIAEAAYGAEYPAFLLEQARLEAAIASGTPPAPSPRPPGAEPYPYPHPPLPSPGPVEDPNANLIEELNALIAAWELRSAELLAVIEPYPGELLDLETLIADAEAEILDLETNIPQATQDWIDAYNAQLQNMIEDVLGGWQGIIQQHTMTDQELQLLALDEWYAEQLIAAELLGLALDDLNYAYELQLQALQNLGDAIDETIASIDDMIDSLTGGALAPVQSAEFYMDKYAGFLEAAMMGTAGAVDELLGFIPEYLDFMSGYGLDYAGLTASIVAQLENLKLTLPGLQHGGLTSGLSFAGEAGPEWVVPTYEPQRSSFLEDVGMDPDKIGEAIARHLIPALGSREINLTIDGQPVRTVITKGLRSDSELINAVRRVN